MPALAVIKPLVLGHSYYLFMPFKNALDMLSLCETTYQATTMGLS
jgi:hypothetical protein